MTSTEHHTGHGSIQDRIEVLVQGDIPYQAHRWAVRAVEDAVRRHPWPLVRARVRLTRPPHLVAVCRADIHADLGGHLFHARAEANDARSAMDVAAERLHRQAVAARAGELAARRVARPQQRQPHPG
jgi:ribosome-associated translation inhibitor RaiA